MKALRYALALAFGVVACGGVATTTRDRSTGGGAGGNAPSGGGSTVVAGASGASPGAGATSAGGGGASSAGEASFGGATGTAGSAASGSAGAAGGAAVCGNGVVEPSEGCDDGNLMASDGCSASCAVEAGFVCSGSPSVCTHPSCAGLAKTCGPNGDQDCCASNIVPVGTFYRGYDGVTYTDKTNPATVSDFRLDTYEITVGRFRKFLAAYSETMIPNGAGKNSNNPADMGWDTAWNGSLEKNASLLVSALLEKPNSTWPTTPGLPAVESQPVNQITWYQAEAFCIWDGGRLPTGNRSGVGLRQTS